MSELMKIHTELSDARARIEAVARKPIILTTAAARDAVSELHKLCALVERLAAHLVGIHVLKPAPADPADNAPSASEVERHAEAEQ